jgi:hypothetical protein
MMGIARLTTADETNVVAATNAPRLRMAQDGFVDRGRWRRELSVMATQKMML